MRNDISTRTEILGLKGDTKIEACTIEILDYGTSLDFCISLQT